MSNKLGASVALALSALFLGLYPSRAQQPNVANGKIAFVSNRAGNNEIYTMNSDGSNVVRLTFSDANDVYPVWSPDGTRIAYSSNHDGLTYDIFVVNADGTEIRNVTQDSSSNDRYPNWSPDGNNIAFSKALRDGSDIYVVDTNNYTQTLLVDGNGETHNLMPTWSPNGQEIMFTSSEELPSPPVLTTVTIEKIRLDGSSQQQIGVGGINTYGNLDWSWENGQVAFYDLDLANNIYIMNSDASDIMRITEADSTNAQSYTDPSWSSNGFELVYQGRNFGDTSSHQDIFITNLQTGSTINLTQDSPYDEMMPDWQPVISM